MQSPFDPQRRRLMAATVAGVASPETLQAAPATDLHDRLVHPELRALLPSLREATRPMRLPTLAGLDAARRGMPVPAALARPSWSVRKVPGRRGQDVRVLVVNAQRSNGQLRPALLHLHGGGFVAGSADASLAALQSLAADLDCVAVSVDYRLAPETRFPGALDDNLAALAWLHANAAELGADPDRIALLGESAGGGHAAMLALAARDRGEVPLLFQALVYPMLDDRTGSTRPVPRHLGQLMWTPEVNRFAWACLLGQPAGGRVVPAGAVPARARNLAGLPPTFIAVGALDLFVAENLQYAQRLAEAGVPTELHLIPGAFHAFDVMAPEATISKAFRATLLQALSRAMASAPAR